MTDLAFHLSGSSSIYERSLPERTWRDAHVLAQNVAGSAVNFENIGRVTLGLPTDSSRI